MDTKNLSIQDWLQLWQGCVAAAEAENLNASAFVRSLNFILGDIALGAQVVDDSIAARESACAWSSSKRGPSKTANEADGKKWQGCLSAGQAVRDLCQLPLKPAINRRHRKEVVSARVGAAL